MKNQSDPDRLLDEIMADVAAPEFRARMLEQTLWQVRRRNRIRRWNRGIVSVVLIVSVPLLGWKLFLAPSKSSKVQSPSFSVVRSQPFDPALIVQTKPGLANILSSSTFTVGVVETEPGINLVKEINDDQLLTLLAGRPVALVREVPNHAELLFLNPDDQNGFPVR